MTIYQDWLDKIEKNQSMDKKLHDEVLAVKKSNFFNQIGIYIPAIFWLVLLLLNVWGTFTTSKYSSWHWFWEGAKSWIEVFIVAFPFMFANWAQKRIEKVDAGIDVGSPYKDCYDYRESKLDKEVALGIAVVSLDELIEKGIVSPKDRTDALAYMTYAVIEKMDMVVVDDHFNSVPKIWSEPGTYDYIYEMDRLEQKGYWEKFNKRRNWVNYLTADLFKKVARTFAKPR